MEIESMPPVVCLSNPRLAIIVTIRRAEDDCDKPCIFRWSSIYDAWGPSGFVVFQHTPDGLKRVEGTPGRPPPRTVKITGYEFETEELLPGQTISRNINSMSPFLDHMVVGERYELVWLGAEYALWAWGTLRDHWEQEIGDNSRLPLVVIPGGASRSFYGVDVEELAEPEPYEPSLIEKSDRIPGAPCICVFLESPSEMSRTEGISITMKITYDGLTNEDHGAINDDTKPIIIHNYPFRHSHCRLQRRCPDYDPSKDSSGDSTQWKTYYDNERNPGWRIVDEPDVEINVTDSEYFRGLKPGESFVKTLQLEDFHLHPDTVVGDTYRYQYCGGCVDWWVWGDFKEHANTVVKLPCWLQDYVVDPDDNDGRPFIMIPSSNFVEFTIVE
ncbi:uncharacterized protein N7500_006077 [Penicillium coprophilum]|uniref:uncharacterized protein n=1 Tax=Penicillium coprophilum TaxID=36646 RepID=UPI0023A01E1A|nr:uncharacterized protein N7500_006077 [Penicillium coprophilum]KAJ5164247.1 hypothetical protein N7500_006077 [Penicillium coprophilum]